jgi:predicted ArsR family transcriptional regulator
LVQQAAALDQKAERLRAQAREFAEQAIELRLAADRQKREPAQIIMQRRVAPERDARLLTKVSETLEQIGPCSSAVVAEHLNVTQQRIYQALCALEKSGAVKRSGIRRGTLWGLADDEDLAGHHERASARTLVLTAARRLDTFDLRMISDELPMLTDEGVRRALRKLVDEGAVTEARDGKRKIYAFEKPASTPVNRPKHELPEAKIINLARRNGGPIQGTGKRARPTDKDVAELFDRIREAGAEIIRQDNGHWQIKRGDQVLEVLPGTPSDWRGLLNARAKLRRAGLAV